MPNKLYLKEYQQALNGKRVAIVCREDLLLDNLKLLVKDIDFVARQGIATSLYHNLSNRSASRNIVDLLKERLPATACYHVSAGRNFYRQVLDAEPAVFKLVLLERTYLCDDKGLRINTLSPKKLLSRPISLVDHVPLAEVIEEVALRVERGDYHRVHIVPAGRYTIKHELFTVEGTGTLIASNFQEVFAQVVSEVDVQMVRGLLDLYRNQGYLKPRSLRYLREYRHQFHITKIDGIAVGCVEGKHIDPQTTELGALAISTRFQGQRVAVFTVRSFCEEARRLGYQFVISLTSNPRLKKLYRQMGFEPSPPGLFSERQARSPGVPMFILTL